MSLARFDAAARLEATAAPGNNDADSATWFRQGKEFSVGKRKYKLRGEHDSWSFLQHPGFERRRAEKIASDAPRLEFTAAKEARAETVAAERRVHLEAQDKRNGGNPIVSSGAEDSYRPSRRVIRDAPSSFLAREGDVALRTSAARFHRPEAVTTSARTERLRNEGLDPAAKMSAILGYGGGDLPSHGVADNFAYACYDPEYARRRDAGAGGGERRSLALAGGGAAIAAARRPSHDPDLAPAVSSAPPPLPGGSAGGSRGAARASASASRGRAADAADAAAVRALR